ncbi:MAG: potassium-transporting ATPase subunit C [Capsulimonadaceae bacterium]|nr:potassium-transporting ATPase subunit C [Capsulimonadaceae bacterium]
MFNQLGTSIKITLVLLVIVSGIYPLAVWGVSQVLLPRQANGSLVKSSSGAIVGSTLIGQGFTKPEYFHPRPSAAGSGYDPTQSSGTNLGPTSDKLINGVHKKLANGKDDPNNFDGVKDLAAAYRTENGLSATARVPVDAVTRSASGLDPDISIENARVQAARVAKARNTDVSAITRLIDKTAHGRDLGFLGEPRVNVLSVNLALDQEYPLNKSLVKPGAK